MNKPCFIAVTNRNLCKRPFFDVIEDLSKKDVKTIVLREKDLSEEEYYEIAEKCKEICDRNGASLTIHNFIDVARRLGIKKIHLPYPVFLKEAGNLSDFESVSTSIHKPEEAIKAQKLGVDFVFAGHVFVTDCKKGLPPRGLEFLNDSCQGLEFSDGDSIYIIGGAAGQKPGIAKLTGSGSSYKYSCLVTATHNNFGGNAESEGIQLKGDYVYFGISDKQSSDKACIYSIPKSAF